MKSHPDSLRVTRHMDFESVRWTSVRELMTSKFRVSAADADIAVRSFGKRFVTPFNLYWFLHRSLTTADNTLVACVCEVHGADEIVLQRDRLLYVAPFRLDYRQEILFRPTFRKTPGADEDTLCVPTIDFTIMGKHLRIQTVAQDMLFLIVLTLVALLSYVAAGSLFLYGLAVFLLFVALPADTASVAARHASVGLALVATIVAMSFLCLRAGKNVIGVLCAKYIVASRKLSARGGSK